MSQTAKDILRALESNNCQSEEHSEAVIDGVLNRNGKSMAMQIHEAKYRFLALTDKVEDEFDAWWEDKVNRITTDGHDNSVEIYFTDDIDATELTNEQQARIWELGFSRCWLNFKGGTSKGGTERTYVCPEILGRYKQK